MTNYTTATVLTVYRDDNDPVPDVHARDFWYGTIGLRGWAQCPPDDTGTGGSHPDFWCRGQVIRFNATYASECNTADLRRKLACHELGHTVGLEHGNWHHAGGIRCTETPSATAGSRFINGVEQGHISDHH